MYQLVISIRDLVYFNFFISRFDKNKQKSDKIRGDVNNERATSDQ